MSIHLFVLFLVWIVISCLVCEKHIKMAFRIIAMRNKRRRRNKLAEIFDEKDSLNTGYLPISKVEEIFRVYKADALIEKVRQGDLEDENGQISRDDFVALSLHSNLLKIRQRRLLEKRKKSEKSNSKIQKSDPSDKPPSCFCFKSTTADLGDDDPYAPQHTKDRVAVAFSKFDLDKDGFLSWEEFQKMGMTDDMAKRIFQFCDSTNRGKITLEEFRKAADCHKEQIDKYREKRNKTVGIDQ